MTERRASAVVVLLLRLVFAMASRAWELVGSGSV
jgi:hypothetical protein